MHSEKKMTKEDTWRPADLRRHIRETADHSDQGDNHVIRKEDSERKRRGGESTERRHRDSEESRQERHLTKEREMHAEQRKESARHREGDKKDEKYREKRRQADSDRERRSRRGDGEDRHWDWEKEKTGDRERLTDEDREKIRQDRDKDRKREEQDREKRKERRRYEESGERKRDQADNQRREEKDGHHRIDHEGKEKHRHIHERHEGQKHSERDYKDEHRKHREEREYKEERRKHREERAYKEEHRKRKEEREKKHRGAEYYDEKRKGKSESKEHRDSKGSGEKVRFSQSDRERDEREKHKEKREKNEVEDGRKYKDRRHRDEENVRTDRTISKKSSSDKHAKKTIEPEEHNVLSDQWAAEVKDEEDAKEPVDEELLAEYYEEDFEDYDEDFEDEDADEGEEEEKEKEPLKPEEKEGLTLQEQKEMEAIKRAMAEENKRAGTAQPRQTGRKETEDRPKWNKDSEVSQIKASQRGKFIDFVAAKRREVSKKDAIKQMKRSTDLRRLIDLDFSVTFSLLDLPPVSEYELYIRSFGNANTKQAYAQCNEDNSEREIQTEEIEMCEKWTQHPPEHRGACGDPNLAQGARERSTRDLNFDSQRLTSFLQSASQVMLVLLEEDQAERKSQVKLNTQPDSLSFSDGSLQINTKLPFLYGRRISMVHFSQVQRHTMLSVHMPLAKPSAVRLDSNTIICIWNIWEPSRPQKILLYESEVQCCCFSPGKAILVFAGTSVGSVVLWDLRELASNHYNLKIGEIEWTIRQPTFSTDAVMAGTGHLSPVTSVEVVPSIVAGTTSLSPDDESSGLTFQLASLDESGVLNFWVVVELPKGSEAGSPTDLGLWPGGKVKLLHSSAILTSKRSSRHNAIKTEPSEALLLKFLPTDSNHFFLGTNLGLVSHETSYGLKALPKFYRFQEVEERPVDVCSIHFSPFRPNCFLVGCGDGSIRMHTVSRELPVAEWSGSTAGEPVLSVQWAQTRPTVFCVLDAASNLHIWDLLKNEAQPVITERITDDRVTAASVFGDSGQQNIYSGIALARESGKIELLYFTKSFTEPCSGEAEKLDSLINDPV